MESQTETLVKDAARVEILIAALKKIGPLQGLTDADFAWLAEHGTEHYEDAGVTLFEENAPATEMTIILKGEIHVSRSTGPAALFIGRAGQISGVMPYSRMKHYGGRGYTVAPTWALNVHKDLFPEMLKAIPAIGEKVVAVLLDRVREVTRMEQQAEKLNALGKLAGNLAHELNNPASAAQRSADSMRKELKFFIENSLKLGHLCLTEAQTSDLGAWHLGTIEALRRERRPDPASIATREDAIQHWLSERQIGEGWKIVPELAELGVEPRHLDDLPSSVDCPTIQAVLLQISSGLRTDKMAEAMLDSTERIFGLIRAIKDYSFMDQAPIQEIDVTQGIESTLMMIHSQTEHATIERQYAPNLPLISAFGSQLNQVWTALIENALEATNFQGRIVIKVKVIGGMLLIEVWDDGPGIPKELQARIFEPFFTTKAPGQGLGLGLDSASRIIRTHRGFLTVESVPGATCFQVRLPIEQAQAY
jgi:signal transduction histidine kinase